MIAKLFQPLEPLDAAEGVLLLRAPSDFLQVWVTQNYSSLIEEQLQALTGQPWMVRWAATPDSARKAPHRAPERPAGRPSAPPGAPRAPPPRTAPGVAAPRTATVPRTSPPAGIAHGLAPRYTFEQFVLGPSNEMAHAMAQAVADRSGRKVNVLFLCGKTGLGKTHLSNAIGHRILEQKPDARIVCVSAEDFTNDYVRSIQGKKMEEFRGRYRSACDALLLDDVQFLAGKEGTQDEFFHTFNSLYQRDAPIVLTSDVLPTHLQGMAERLLSRFSQGMVAEITPPEMETRVAILKAKAARENTRIEDEAAFAVASAMNTNVRELEGLLMKLAVKATLAGKSAIDLSLVREALKIGARPAVVTVEDVQKAVCEHYRIKLGQLTGRERHREVALPRQVAMFLARVHLGTSFPQLGARFNGKDHTTVISAVRRVEKLLAESRETRETIEALSLKLGFSPPKTDNAPVAVPAQETEGV
jgi:chromosomal replication initiator protein